jgi:hypothetical protein
LRNLSCQLTTERTSKALPVFRELILGRWILAGRLAWRCNRRRCIGFDGGPSTPTSNATGRIFSL